MIIAHLADAPCTFVVPQTFTPSLQVRVRMDLDRAASELTLEDFDSQVGLAMGRSQGTNRCGQRRRGGFQSDGIRKRYGTSGVANADKPRRAATGAASGVPMHWRKRASRLVLRRW